MLLDNEAIELEFISVLIYYTYMRKLGKEESMMCRNDKGRVDPKWKTQQYGCSVTCETGTAQRDLMCIDQSDGSKLHESHCQEQHPEITNVREYKGCDAGMCTGKWNFFKYLGKSYVWLGSAQNWASFSTKS